MTTLRRDDEMMVMTIKNPLIVSAACPARGSARKLPHPSGAAGLSPSVLSPNRVRLSTLGFTCAPTGTHWQWHQGARALFRRCLCLGLKFTSLSVPNSVPPVTRAAVAVKRCRHLDARFSHGVMKYNLANKVSLVATGCSGPFAEAGASVLVYPGNVLYANVTEADVDTIIQQHLISGTPVAAQFAPAELW